MNKVIKTIKAPKAIGPYSQAILSKDTLYCSGQIAINPINGKLIIDNINDETSQVMENISQILNEVNMNFSNVVKCTIFMKNMRDYKIINNVYAKYFSNYTPAREAVEVSALPKGVNVEISIIAVK